MRGGVVLVLWFWCAAGVWAQDAFRLPDRSVSASKQFVVFCDDPALRMQVASFAEATKSGVLKLLAEADQWETPIVILLAPPATAAGMVAPSSVRVFEVEEGMKIQIDVALRGNLAEAQFPRQLVRAILLELACRTRLAAGAPLPDPPAWLVAGILAHLEAERKGTETDVYRRLLDVNRYPGLEDFLRQDLVPSDSSLRAFHSACSLALVRLLVGMPDGARRLAQLVRNLPQAGDNRLGELRRFFPELGEDAMTMEKWWALSLAKLSAAERYKGLGLAESDQRLTDALVVTLQDAGSEPKTFALGEFRAFVKTPWRAAVIDRLNRALVALQAVAHPLLRPVVEEYLDILAQVAKGKTRGVERRIAKAEDYRVAVVKRGAAIADYLNWYEATQLTMRSGAFEGYLRMAAELAREPRSRHGGPIGRYLDSVEAALAGE